MSDMKALITTRIYAPEAAAASFRLQALAKALSERGDKVTVLTSRTTDPESDAEFDAKADYEIRRAPVLRDKTGYVRGYAQYMSFDIPLAFRLLTARRPDVIVNEPPPTTGFVTGLVSKIRRIPNVYYAADIWSDAASSTGAPSFVVKLLTMLESLAFRMATCVIAINDGVAERAKELGAKNVRIVSNGIDTDTFSLEGEIAEDAPKDPYFLYAGTASEWQGADIFVKALRKIWNTDPKTKLVFLGQGTAFPRLKELAKGDERIIFHSSVPPEEAAKWQRGATAALVSIIPGIGYDFAYPTKLFAALSCGTPVLYTGPGPAHKDVRKHDLGEAADYNVDAVASAMKSLLDEHKDPEKLREWVINNRSLKKTGEEAANVVGAISS